MTELKPCPFCGGPGVEIGCEYFTCGAGWDMECPGHQVRADTAEAWNTRAGTIDRAKTEALFADHYWDSFQHDKFLILKHVKSVLDRAEGKPATAADAIEDIRSDLREITNG